jgi:uncharacterized protein
MLNNFTAKNDYLVGVISDTHGRLPQSVLTVFKGADLIVHAGDIGKPEILESLGQIAPIIGVRGNMDMGHWARHLPEKKVIKISQIMLCVIHDVYRFELNPNSSSCQIVVSGHTHRPLVEKHREVLFLNPGSAVQPRYGYPASVALLRIIGETSEARLIEL